MISLAVQDDAMYECQAPCRMATNELCSQFLQAIKEDTAKLSRIKSTVSDLNASSQSQHEARNGTAASPEIGSRTLC
jgi:hypothetical protein